MFVFNNLLGEDQFGQGSGSQLKEDGTQEPLGAIEVGVVESVSEFLQQSGGPVVMFWEWCIDLGSRKPSNEDSDDDGDHESLASGQVFLVEKIIRLVHRSPRGPGKSVEQDRQAQSEF